MPRATRADHSIPKRICRDVCILKVYELAPKEISRKSFKIAIKPYRSVCCKVARGTRSLWGNRRRTTPYRDANSSSCNARPQWISGTSASVSRPNPWVGSTSSDATRSSCSSCRPRARLPPSCPSRSPVPRLGNEEWGSCRRSSNCYCPGSNQLRPTLEACTPLRLPRAKGLL